jgi:hypothetical protein
VGFASLKLTGPQEISRTADENSDWQNSAPPSVSKKVVIPAKAGIQFFQDLLDAGSSPA